MTIDFFYDQIWRKYICFPFSLFFLFSLSIREIWNDLMMTLLLLFLYSSLVISATNQVYQSLANLIRWSDTVLLTSDKSLDKESVGEIAKSVYEAVHVNQYKFELFSLLKTHFNLISSFFHFNNQII